MTARSIGKTEPALRDNAYCLRCQSYSGAPIGEEHGAIWVTGDNEEDFERCHEILVGRPAASYHHCGMEYEENKCGCGFTVRMSGPAFADYYVEFNAVFEKHLATHGPWSLSDD